MLHRLIIFLTMIYACMAFTATNDDYFNIVLIRNNQTEISNTKRITIFVRYFFLETDPISSFCYRVSDIEIDPVIKDTKAIFKIPLHKKSFLCNYPLKIIDMNFYSAETSNTPYEIENIQFLGANKIWDDHFNPDPEQPTMAKTVNHVEFDSVNYKFMVTDPFVPNSRLMIGKHPGKLYPNGLIININ